MRRTILIFDRPKVVSAIMVIFLLIFGGAVITRSAVTQDSVEMPNELEKRIFVIDPGHGGVDGGTNSKDFIEKEINLEVAKKLQFILVERGAIVTMTREQDISPGNTGEVGKGYNYRKALNTRVVIIEKNNPDVFLSIHVNASRKTAASGSIVYFNKAVLNAGLLSEILQKHLNAVTEKHGFRTHKPKSIDFYILRHTVRPGAVVELGFMTHQQEKELLKQDEYQWELAGALADGLNEYFWQD